MCNISIGTQENANKTYCEPISQGEPNSSSLAKVALLIPFRFTSPIGWTGGKYNVSKPILATRVNKALLSLKVACSCVPFDERGKNSYHVMYNAFFISTETCKSANLLAKSFSE